MLRSKKARDVTEYQNKDDDAAGKVNFHLNATS